MLGATFSRRHKYGRNPRLPLRRCARLGCGLAQGGRRSRRWAGCAGLPGWTGRRWAAARRATSGSAGRRPHEQLLAGSRSLRQIAAFGQGNGCEALPVERNVRRPALPSISKFNMPPDSGMASSSSDTGAWHSGCRDRRGRARTSRLPGAACLPRLRRRTPTHFPRQPMRHLAYPVEADVGRTLTGCALGCALPFVYQRDRQRLLDEAQ